MTVSAQAAVRRATASFIQRRIFDLALDGRDHETCVVVWEMSGRFDAERWRRALDRLVERHETLRTKLIRADGEVVQAIEPTVRLACELVDARGSAERYREAVVSDLAQRAAEPFVLADAPLARVAIHELADDERLVVWAFSHAIWDAYCDNVLKREIAAAYDGEEPPRAPLQLREIVAQERLPPPRAARARAVELASIPAADEGWLEGDRPYVAVTHAVGRLSAAAQRRLDDVAGGNLGTLLLAVHGLGLRALLGRDRLSIGLLDADREGPARETTIACLMNVLIVPVTLSADAVEPALAATRDALFDAYDHRIPFEHQLAGMDAARQRGTSAVVDSLFNYQPPAVRDRQRALAFAGLTVRSAALRPVARPMSARGPWAGARLCLCAIAEPTGQLRLWYVHDAERSEAVRALAGQLRRTIAELSADATAWDER